MKDGSSSSTRPISRENRFKTRPWNRCKSISLITSKLVVSVDFHYPSNNCYITKCISVGYIRLFIEVYIDISVVLHSVGQKCIKLQVLLNHYYILSNVILVDVKLASFHQYLSYSHKFGAIAFSMVSAII